MATSKKFIESFLEQTKMISGRSVKPMFGEYGLYLNDVFIGMICDDRIFLKKNDNVTDLPEAKPYPGAKNHLLFTEPGDTEKLEKIMNLSYQALKNKKERPEKYDFKVWEKQLYRPSRKPSLVTVPVMNFIAVRGKGDPNETDGDYQAAMKVLYSLAFTLSMSPKNGYSIPDFFEYVVPPLEGLWEGVDEMQNSQDKSKLSWISMIRIPDFIRKEDFDWAVREVNRKKKIDCSGAEFLTYDEGLCVQCMHIGEYDKEYETIEKLHSYVQKNGLTLDFGKRAHHEIYLSDPRRTKPENLKTVLRLPVRYEV